MGGRERHKATVSRARQAVKPPCAGRRTPALVQSRVRRAFTLIEVLVTIGIIAVLIAIVLPSLRTARESARSALCLSNLRQQHLLIRAYADDHRGFTPALGQPYAASPNWGVVIQNAAGQRGQTADSALTTSSILVCPTARAVQARAITRSYAINATGRAGQPGDPDNFDAGPVHVAMDRVAAPGQTPLLLDAAFPRVLAPGVPPPIRSSSVLDLRNEAHVQDRIARVHTTRFNVVFYDASITAEKQPPAIWRTPLP